AFGDDTVSSAGGFVLGRRGDVPRHRYQVGTRGGQVYDVLPPLDRFVEPSADPHLVLPLTNCAFRRGALHDVGGWPRRATSGSAIELCRRLIDAGHRLTIIPDAMVQHEADTMSLLGWTPDTAEASDELWTRRFVVAATAAVRAAPTRGTKRPQLLEAP